MRIRSIVFAFLFGYCFLVQLDNPMVEAQQTNDSEQDSSEDIVLPKLGDKLTDAQVASFAKLALKNIHTEYPNKPSNIVWDAESVRQPKEMHPARFGTDCRADQQLPKGVGSLLG